MRSRFLPVFLTCALPMFMAALDNLVVTTALATVRADFDASLAQLQWIADAYLLGFAALLLTATSLGDRWGRRRVFLAGTALFTAASIGCALADSAGQLIAARAVQGVGAAALVPLSLTLLTATVPVRSRDLAIGLWSAAAGVAICVGPVVGGAVVVGADWRSIFWLNVPVGVLTLVLGSVVLRESFGPDGTLDVRGMLLVTGGLLAGIWATVHGHDRGWTSAPVLTAYAGTVVLFGLFARWERRAPDPLLPLRWYRLPQFVLGNVAALGMHFGVFGSVFLLVQLLQVAMGLDPLQAGLRTLAWTLLPMIFAPLSGLLLGRIGGRRLLTGGLLLQAAGLAWLAVIVSPDTPWPAMVPPMVLGGIGMGLAFPPATALALAAVRPVEQGRASGANTTARETGGALGIAILATVFDLAGGYGDPHSFAAGTAVAVWVGVGVVVASAVLAVLIPETTGGRTGAALGSGAPGRVPQRAA